MADYRCTGCAVKVFDWYRPDGWIFTLPMIEACFSKKEGDLPGMSHSIEHRQDNQ
jgi:hypothetical protein